MPKRFKLTNQQAADWLYSRLVTAGGRLHVAAVKELVTRELGLDEQGWRRFALAIGQKTSGYAYKDRDLRLQVCDTEGYWSLASPPDPKIEPATCLADPQEEDRSYDPVSVTCPFCGHKVLSYTGQADALSNDPCKHLVFLHSWALDLWNGADTLANTDDEHLNQKLREITESASGPEDICARVVRELRKKKGWTVKGGTTYQECGMGPRGGGPTYTTVFRQRKKRRTHG